MATPLEINEVTAIYNDILFRAPDSSGLTFWSGILDAGLLNTEQLISVFIASTEAVTIVEPIIRLYTGLFGRAPDIGGLQHWVAQMDGGASFNTIVENFVDSQEFANDYNAGVIGTIPLANSLYFVEALYYHMLGRAGDPAGLAGWVNVLDNGNGTAPTLQSEATVVEGFVNSAEYIGDVENGITSWLTSGALSALAGTTSSAVGAATFPTTIASTAATIYLTTSIDTVTSGVNVIGTLGGTSPTLMVENVTNLTLIDSYGTGDDIIPSGVTLQNITNVLLETAGNAGGYNTGAWFNVSGISNLQNVTVESQGDGVDGVQAGPNTNVVVEHNNSGAANYDGGVDVIGGANVTVTNAGAWGVVIGNDGGIDAESVPPASELPTGNIVVNENSGVQYDSYSVGDATYYYNNVQIMGGVNVTVNVTSDSWGGNIDIGNVNANTGNYASGGDTNPTGVITITDDSENNSSIYVDGGSSVNITASGDYIVVGECEPESATDNTSGDVTIINTAPFVWGQSSNSYEEDVYVYGGDDVTVTTNTGNVYIGGLELNSTGTAVLAGTDPAGDVNVTDTATAFYWDDDCAYTCVDVDVYGGNNVTVTATQADVEVGDIDCGVVVAPLGTVTINDIAPIALGSPGAVNAFIEVIGGTNISIDSNTALCIAVGADDLNSTETAALAGENPSGTVTVIDGATEAWASVKVYGGTDVSVSTQGTSVKIGTINDCGPSPVVIAPTGNITVVDEAPLAYDDILNSCAAGICIVGGDNVTVGTNAGGVTIGTDCDIPGANPAGDIQVTDIASGLWSDCGPDVQVYGGVNVTITVDDASVYVGDGTALDDPTGNVIVTVNGGVQTSNEYHNTIDVAGGVDVTIHTTGAASWCGTAIEVGVAPCVDEGVVTSPANPVTGTVSITDTHSGWNYTPEDILVIGGTSVTIDTGLIECSTVEVGFCPGTNAPGTAYTDLNADPTGNVTINQSATYGSTTVYGDAHDEVFIDGGTTVSLTGGDDAEITDVNGYTIPCGPDQGDLVGTSTLTTVSLTGVDGDVCIFADALTTLNISDNTVCTSPDVYLNYTDAHNAPGALTINLVDEQGVYVEDDGDAITGPLTVTATVTTTAYDSVTLDFSAVTSMIFDNTAALLVDIDPIALKSIKAEGSGQLFLGDLSDASDYGHLASITSTGSGPVYVEINPNMIVAESGATPAPAIPGTSFAGGTATVSVDGIGNVVVVTETESTYAVSGSDYYTTGTAGTVYLGTGVTVDGGTGSSNNLLYADLIGGGTFSSPTSLAAFTHFQSLGLMSNDSNAEGFYDATGFTQGLYVGLITPGGDAYGLSDNVGFVNVAQGTPLTILDDDGDSWNIIYSLHTAFSPTAPGSVTIQIGQDAGSSVFGESYGVDASGGVNLSQNGVTSDGIGTVTINSEGACVNDLNVYDGSNNLNYTDTSDGGSGVYGVGTGSITTLTITGDASISVSNDDQTVTTIDASANTGHSVNVDGVDPSAIGFTVIGGSALLSANGEQANMTGASDDLYYVGTGGGFIETGPGGAGNLPDQNDALSFDTGYEIIESAAVYAAAPSGVEAALAAQSLSGTTIELSRFPISSASVTGADESAGAGSTATIYNWAQGTISNGKLANTLWLGANDVNDSGAVQLTVAANGTDLKGTSIGDYVSSGFHYNLIDGVFTVDNVAGNPSGSPDGEQMLDDAQAILDQSTPADGTIAMVTVPINSSGPTDNVLGQPVSDTSATYVIMYDGGGSADTLVEIVGLTGTTGFGIAYDAENPSDPLNIGGGTSVNVWSSEGETFLSLFANVTNPEVTYGSAVANKIYYETNNGNSPTAVTNPGISGAYAVDFMENSGVGFTNSYLDFANFAALFIDGGGMGIEGGNVTVTQVGADPIFTVVVNVDTNLGTLNVDAASTQATLAIVSTDDWSVGINTIVDNGGGASTIYISDNGEDSAVQIGAITDSALTNINASDLSGGLYLGSEAAPITQAGLTITVGTVVDDQGDSWIFASGAGDDITVGSACDAGCANVIVQAAGANDDISVYIGPDPCDSGPGAIIGAAGSGDTLTLVGGDGCNPCFDATSVGTVEGVLAAAGTKDSAYDLAYDALYGTGWVSSEDCYLNFNAIAPTAGDTSLGSGDTVNIGNDCNDTTAIVWLGENSTVNVACGNTTADIYVTGDVTGATSAVVTGSTLPATLGHETINWGDGSNLNLLFFNAQLEAWAGGCAATSDVNVANATSLGNALDIAAGQAAVLDQNFGGGCNTTPVPGGPLEINANTGLIDWFQYGGNTYLIEAINNTTSAAAHNALGTHDVVVELIGLVNVNCLNCDVYGNGALSHSLVA